MLFPLLFHNFHWPAGWLFLGLLLVPAVYWYSQHQQRLAASRQTAIGTQGWNPMSQDQILRLQDTIRQQDATIAELQRTVAQLQSELQRSVTDNSVGSRL